MSLYKNNKAVSTVLFAAIFFMLTGCGLVDINEQAEIIENAGTIKGSVVNNSAFEGAIIISLFQKKDEFLNHKTNFKLPENGTFKITVLPDEYTVAAYVDSNENNKYDIGEAGKFYAALSTVHVGPMQTVKLDRITITGPPVELPDKSILISSEKKIVKNIGAVTTLNDSTFNKGNYSLGMWKPLDFIDNVGGGLFLLSPYDN